MASMCYVQLKPEGILLGAFSLHLKQSAFRSRLISCMLVYQVLDAFAKWRKATIWLLHVCLSVRRHGTTRLLLKNFKSYLSIFRKSVEKIQALLKSDKNNEHFSSRPLNILYHISPLISSSAEKCFRQKL
jgi:hypothetical protein